jgi:dimethylamine/trimethylamine dehydrogenase
VPGSEGAHVVSPDDVMAGRMPEGPVVVFDDDRYYMGNVMAEVLRKAGREVTLVTPDADIAAFSKITLEMDRVYRHMDELGIAMITHHNLEEVGDGQVLLRHVRTDREMTLPANGVVMVTARLPNSGLYDALMADEAKLAEAGIKSVTRIGDCNAPAAIVHATYAGHRYARELDTAPSDRLFRHELPYLHAEG